MLANATENSSWSGDFSSDVQLPATSQYALLDFIADQLPRWRDRPDRPRETSETALTSQLCAHLNSAARHSDGWDILQFRTETPDEQKKGRKIDLIPSPRGATICIEGRRYTDFDALMPIECKRLPTPKDKDRDEREYVFNRQASTGGIQRFKEGNHGAIHTIGAMIGYIQEETTTIWNTRIAGWITDLANAAQSGWSSGDMLRFDRSDTTQRLTVLCSSHGRQNGLPEIELRHLWVEMN